MRESHIVALDSTHPDSGGGYALRCENCGIIIRIKVPLAVSEFTGITQGFIDRHRDCSVVETVPQPKPDTDTPPQGTP